MAWAEKRPNGKYRAGWRDRDGEIRRSRAIYLNKTAAEGAGWDEERKARLSVAIADAHRITWVQWLPLWLEVRDVDDSTTKIDAGTIRKHVIPRWGSVPLAEITRHDVQAWVNKLKRQMAPGTVSKVYHLLSASLNAAVDANVLTATPCVRIKLPPPEAGHERFYSVEEVAAIVNELDPPYRAATLLLAGSGMRFGEMAGLHESRLEREYGRAHVVETWSRHLQRMTRLPKGSRVHWTIVPDWVLDELDPPREATSCGLPHDEFSAECRSGLVIPAPRGGALDSKNMLRRHWHPAMLRAGIPKGRQHDLRHTFASWQAQAGTPTSMLADLLGHSSERMVRRIYRHMNDAHLDPAREVFRGERFERLSAPSSAPRPDLKIIRGAT